MGKMMLTAPGTFKNPADKSCWKMCPSCYRCENKDRLNCGATCSGRLDMDGMRLADVDDYCRCKEGKLQFVTQEGQLIQIKFKSNPYAGTVKYDNIGKDEADWNSYLADTRERLNDPTYDPIQFEGGGSVEDYLKNG